MSVIINRKTIFGLMFVLLAQVLFGATVFIYTVSEGTEDTLKNFVPYIEDGMMGEFFDAGHIVFNASTVNAIKKRGTDLYKESEDFLDAKSSGASYLMEVTVHYKIEEEKELPVSADYRFFNIISGELLTRGKLGVSFDDDEKKSPDKKLFTLGQSMVMNLLGFL